MEGDVVIELEAVQVAFERPNEPPKIALDDVSLTIHRGEFVAVVGHNGSGKSTLAKLCNGLLVPTAGHVWVAGMDTAYEASLHAIHGVVGMVFQDPESQMVATVVEQDVAFGLENYGVPVEEMKSRVEWALKRVDMWEHRHRPPHQLSGGQKQRVAIAAVMAMKPECIIFDESTSMLDGEGRRAVLDAMMQLHADGVAIVLVTHHMDEVAQASRVIVMHEGKVVRDGSPKEVFADADQLRAWRLEVPQVQATADGLRTLGWELPVAPSTVSELYESLQLAVVDKIPWHARFPSPQRDAVEASVDLHTKGSPSVQVEDLHHIYMRNTPLAHPSLRGVSLAIEAGEFVALIGKTGSGKSTLIQHLNGLIRPQQGRVVVEGISTRDKRADLRRLRSMVALAFQNPEEQLFEALVGDDVAFGPFQYGYSLEEVRERVRFALHAVGLSFDWRDTPIYGLSGGERRKVGLAGVLAMGPSVLILDEPTAGLDPASRQEIGHNIKRLQQEAGTTVLWVTHHLQEAAQYADRIVVLENGELVEDTSTRQLFMDEVALNRLNLTRPGPAQLVHDLRLTGMPIPEDVCVLTMNDAIQAIHHALLLVRTEGTPWKS